MSTLPTQVLEPEADSTKIVTPMTFEIVPDDLALPAEEKQSLITTFSPLLDKARELLEESKGITSAKLARVSRLQFVKLRGDSERMRKSLKEHHLRMGKAIDGAHNILVAAVHSQEKRMEDIEKAEERRIQAENDARGADRFGQLSAVGMTSYLASHLGTMAQSDFDVILADATALNKARLEREEQERNERLKKELEEAQERERVRKENERLEQEKKDLEARLEKERKEAEERLEAERAENKRKQDEADAAAKKRQEEADALARKQKEEADALLAEETRKREAAEEATRLERETREKEQREREAAELARKEDEDRKQREADAAAEAALLAPDKEKILTVANMLRHMLVPPMKSKKGTSIAGSLAVKISNLADWIEERAEAL